MKLLAPAPAETLRGTHPDDYARRALGTATLGAERVLSVVRALFCLAVAVRFIVIHAAQPDATALARGSMLLSATAFGVIFSVIVLNHIRRGDASPRLLAACTLTESLVCTLAIASNVLWPFPGYRGVLLLPESITFVACVFIAGLRASSSLTLLASLTSGFGIAVLTALDVSRNGNLVQYGANVMSLHAILLIASVSLALFGASRTERLVREAAWYSFRNGRAERGFQHLLHEHHDALGVLSAALFSVERLRTTQDAGSLVELKQDLEILRGLVGGIRERALTEVLSICPPTTTDLAGVLVNGRATFERAVEPLSVTWRLQPAVPVLVAGGARSVQRIILNLLTNAKQGDGRAGAKHAVVSLVVAGQGLLLTVEDDGPGFVYREATSSKASGAGAGLEFVKAVATASGGELRVPPEVPEPRVQVWLPLANAGAVIDRRSE